MKLNIFTKSMIGWCVRSYALAMELNNQQGGNKYQVIFDGVENGGFFYKLREKESK